MQLHIAECSSPLGTIEIIARNGAVCGLGFVDHGDWLRRSLRARFGAFELVAHATPNDLMQPVQDYFAGHHAALDRFRIDTGGTGFQQRVWQALRRVPAGSTISYGALAARLGYPNAARAVGRSNALNPIALVIPCHRVIGARGELTGYAGGLQRKRALLELESHDGQTRCDQSGRVGSRNVARVPVPS